MKFLPEDKKKTVRSLIALLVAVSGIVYFNFFSGPKTEILQPTDTVNVTPAAPAGRQANLAGGQPPPAPPPIQSQGGLLPYGGKIDLGILDNPKFKILKSTQPLGVAPEELGRQNLFGD